MLETKLSAILFSQITHLPFLLIFVVGIILAVVRWSAHPRVSLLALVAFSLLLLSSIVRMGYMFWLIGGQESGFTSYNAHAIMTWINLSMTVLEMIGWLLLMMALFGWRKVPADAGPA
jgi:hypothetical protein